MLVIFINGSAQNNIISIGVKSADSLRQPGISKTISTLQRLNPNAAKSVTFDTVISYILASI